MEAVVEAEGRGRPPRYSVLQIPPCAARTAAGSALFRPYWAKLSFVSLLIVVSSCLGVIPPFLLRGDPRHRDPAATTVDMELLTLLAGGMIAIAIVTGAFGVVQSLPLDAGRPERDARPAHGGVPAPAAALARVLHAHAHRRGAEPDRERHRRRRQRPDLDRDLGRCRR